MKTTWSLEELAEKSQRYLPDDGAALSGPVQWRPSGRQIRYYSTLGLLDKPETENGRMVWYGPKHLLQLLAIKEATVRGVETRRDPAVAAGSLGRGDVRPGGATGQRS